MDKSHYGSTISRDDSWLLEIAHIPQELREQEAELGQSRWFDYRDLLPAQATYLFADFYDVVYREFYAMTRDYESAETVMTRIKEDVFASSELISFWRARQEADRIGCRYDFYLRFIFKRVWDRGHRMLPRPNQLYGEELVLDIKDAWEHTIAVTLQKASKPRFMQNAFVGHPDQTAYYTYLVEQIKKREHPYMLLARLVFKEKVLPEKIAGEHFGGDVLNRAKSF